MVITCEQCQARFRLADEKLKPEGTKVRCSKCKLVFTVFPPESPTAAESIDSADLDMAPGAAQEITPAALPIEVPASVSAAAPPPSPEPSPAPTVAPVPVSPAATGELDLDFSGLEQSMGPGTGDSELAEEFSFADTAVAATEPPAEEGFAPEPADNAFTGEFSTGDGQVPGELDFDATFAESEGPPEVITPAAGPSEFAFDEELAKSEAVETAAEATTFDFATEPETSAPGEFDFAAEAETSVPGEFDLATEPAAPAAGEFEFPAEESISATSEFGFETKVNEGTTAPDEAAATTAEAASFEFGSGDSFESSALPEEPVFGEAGASWDQPAKQEGVSFDFDEPNFETKDQERVSKSRDDAGLSFGEIDFSDDDTDATPNFGNEPDFSKAVMAPASEPEPLPVPPPPPPRHARRHGVPTAGNPRRSRDGRPRNRSLPPWCFSCCCSSLAGQAGIFISWAMGGNSSTACC